MRSVLKGCVAHGRCVANGTSGIPGDIRSIIALPGYEALPGRTFYLLTTRGIHMSTKNKQHSTEETGSGELPRERPDPISKAEGGMDQGAEGLTRTSSISSTGEGTQGSLLETPSETELEEALLGGESAAGKDLRKVEAKMKGVRLGYIKPSGSQRYKALKEKALARGDPPPPPRKKRKKNRASSVPGSSPSGDSLNTCGTPKRYRMEDGTPGTSQQEGQPSKKLRVGEPGGAPSFRDATAFRKVAIALEAYPQDRLTEGQVMSLRQHLAEVMLASEDDRVPRFIRGGLEMGVLVLTCEDQWSGDWVLDTVKRMTPWGDLKLRAGNLRDILRTAKIILRTPRELRDKDVPSVLKAIKARGYRVRLCLETVRVKVLGVDRRGPKGAPN